MLTLLETLRKLVVSGYEPAPYLVTVDGDGVLHMTLEGDAGPGSFRVGAREMAGGYCLEVSDGQSRYRLEQFCRKQPGGRWDLLPEAWRQSQAVPSLPTAQSNNAESGTATSGSRVRRTPSRTSCIPAVV